jgi:threonine dehydratase
LAYIVSQVKSNKMELPEAIEAAQRRAQERQATPAEPGAPETMPGLATPGMGAEQPAAPAPGGLDGLLAQLGGGGAAVANQPTTPGAVLSLGGQLSG